ncbi:MAG: hypothetical protein ABEH40_05585 [Haloferacaceae archaeon]
MSGEPTSGSSAIIDYLLDEEYVLGTLVYVVLCVPAYFWLEGPVGIAGTVDGSVVIISMITGSILIVPAIAKFLRSRFGVGVPENLERIQSEAFKDSIDTLSQEEGGR